MAEEVIVNIDKIRFMEACLENERQTLAFMKAMGITTPDWERKQADKIAWMEQEIVKAKRGQNHKKRR